MAERPALTTASGMPIADNQNSITAGLHGPLLMQGFHLLEELAHRIERIPSAPSEERPQRARRR
jgi:catalase